jgi:hypothetical protein
MASVMAWLEDAGPNTDILEDLVCWSLVFMDAFKKGYSEGFFLLF